MEKRKTTDLVLFACVKAAAINEVFIAVVLMSGGGGRVAVARFVVGHFARGMNR